MVFKKGNKTKSQFKKGHKGYWKGKKLSEETKRKIGLGNKGKIRSEEIREKMSIASKGKSYEERYGKEKALKLKKIRSKANKGHKLSKETRRKMSESHKGFKHTIETKLKMKGRNNPNFGFRGKHHTEETKRKISLGNKGKINSHETIEKIKKARAKQILPVKDTTIEVKIQNFLKELGIEFFTHQYMKIEHGYQCDIFIPVQNGIAQKTIIECFGDYWHKIPYGNPVDSLRCQKLREQGYRVLVFWENEIKVMQVNDLRNKIFA